MHGRAILKIGQYTKNSILQYLRKMQLGLSINARIMNATGDLEQVSKMMIASKLVYYMLRIPALRF